MNDYPNNWSKAPRPGLRDLWNSSLYEGADWTELDNPKVRSTATHPPEAVISWQDAKRMHKTRIAAGDCRYRVNAFIHCLIDDQKFDGEREGIWKKWDYFYEVAAHFDGITGIDFSTYADFPEPLKRFQLHKMRTIEHGAIQRGIPVIAARVAGLDLREHPTKEKQLGSKQRKEIAKKIKNRTATREEWKKNEWDRRIRKRRKEGIDDFWAKEIIRLSNGEKGTRNWSPQQVSRILAGKKPKFNGKTMESHHTYSVQKYPHLANLGEIIYPATFTEHRKGWHGGNTRNSLPGRRIRPITEF